MIRNLILIGPMGVGKTTIGRQLAKQLKMEFVDSDHEIEERTGVAISTIFEIEGEAGFRKRETAMLQELLKRQNLVLATGGGAISSEVNRKNMRKSGTVIYLHAGVDTQLARTRDAKNRPLLDTDDPREKLEALMKVREPLYRQEADIAVNAEDRPPATVVREILRRLGAK